MYLPPPESSPHYPSLPELAGQPLECACPVCATAAKSDLAFFGRDYDDPEACAATSEAISESLGLCFRHGAILRADERRAGQFAKVLRSAIPRLGLLLDEKHLQTAPVQQILFGPDDTCPACAYSNRTAGRHAARLARKIDGAEGVSAQEQFHLLCVRHFGMFEASLPIERRLAALADYSGHLGQVNRKLKSLLRAEAPLDVWSQHDAVATLHRAIGLTADRLTLETAPFPGASSGAVAQHLSMADAIAHAHACPLCVMAARARGRWLKKARQSAPFGEDSWLALPVCPQHVAMTVWPGEPGLAAAAASHALTMAARTQHRQIHKLNAIVELREKEARIKAEGPEAWVAYRRKRTYRNRSSKGQEPQSVLVPGVPGVPGVPRCPACEWDEVSLERATGDLMELLHEKKHRNAYVRGHGLCLKHFARVYLVAPKGPIRTMLAEDVQRRLAGLMRQDAPLAEVLGIFCTS